MRVIPRPIYLDNIVTRLNKGVILILTGQRRVGKSFMLRLLKDFLQTNHPKANILYINKEVQQYSFIKDAQNLYELVNEKLPPDQENYLLVDEVQDIKNFEDALRSLHAEDRCQIVATGSNAFIFSSELSTRLAGRFIEIPIHSLCYEEFLRFHKMEDSEQSLLSFIKVGGLPGLSNFDISDETQVYDYLQGVYSTVLIRDVITREKIRNAVFLENLSKFVAECVGKLVSSRSLAQFMGANGENISEPIVSSYLNYLCNALIIQKASRYDIHGKKLFLQNHKFFFSDHGLRNFLTGFDIRNSIEKIIENIVFNYLILNGFKVSVGILRVGEIDFVAQKGGNKIYVQVCYLLSTEETINREFGNLASIKDNYPKFVVSMDPLPGGFSKYPGIIHMHLREFLKFKL